MKKQKKDFKNLKLIILIILLIILFITSFRSGEKFYTLRNTNFDTLMVKNKSLVSRWNFNARINYFADNEKEENSEFY